MAKAPEEWAEQLVQRICLLDDGPERAVAVDKLVKTVRAGKVNITNIIIPNSQSRNPYRFMMERNIAKIASIERDNLTKDEMIREKDTRIANLETMLNEKDEQIRELQEMVKKKNPPFPWNKHPEIEERICTDHANGQGKSDKKVADMVFKSTGIPCGHNQVTQKLHNSPLPTRLFSAPGSGPLTWIEVWFLASIMLGSKINRDPWPPVVFEWMGVEARKRGTALDDLPQDQVEALRSHVRTLMKKEILASEKKKNKKEILTGDKRNIMEVFLTEDRPLPVLELERICHERYSMTEQSTRSRGSDLEKRGILIVTGKANRKKIWALNPDAMGRLPQFVPSLNPDAMERLRRQFSPST